MGQYHLLAVTNCTPGSEAEFNRWYDEQHVPDVLTVPGVVEARRFSVVPGFESPLPWRFLTLYTLDTEAPGDLLTELGNRIGSPLMPLTPVMDMDSAGAAILELVAGPATRKTQG